jgi:HSP20 family protein
MTQAKANPTPPQQTQGQWAPPPLIPGLQGRQRGLIRRDESMPAMLNESPFSLVRRFSEDMDRFFGDVFADFGVGRGWTAPRSGRDVGLTQADWSPAIEVVERDDELVVCVDLPGMSAEDVNVEVTDDMLTIAGERRDEREEPGPGYGRSERRYGRFSRSIELPEGVSADDMRAVFRNGVLEVAMPAPQRAGRGRRIEVDGGARGRAQASDEQARAALVEEFKEALKRTDEIQLTVTGRVSGRKISQPVWFVQEGDILYLLPVRGSDSQWFKNVLENPTITLTARRVTLTTNAIPITDHAKVREIVEKFRAKYGAEDVKKYYSKFDVAVAVPLA